MAIDMVSDITTNLTNTFMRESSPSIRKMAKEFRHVQMDSCIRDNGRKEKNKIVDFLLTLWEMSIKAPF